MFKTLLILFFFLCRQSSSCRYVFSDLYAMFSYESLGFDLNKSDIILAVTASASQDNTKAWIGIGVGIGGGVLLLLFVILGAVCFMKRYVENFHLHKFTQHIFSNEAVVVAY